MLLSNIEYILLRLIRRFVFPNDFLIKYGAYIPYYRVNLNQFNPSTIVGDYNKYLQVADIDPTNLISILEIGVGATNSSGYEMAFQGFAKKGEIIMFEPYAAFNQSLDNKIYTDNAYPDAVRDRFKRLKKLSDIESNSIDLILSNSVLEHVDVDDFSALIYNLNRVLKPEACMLHIVDYKDHFFKYPYHFLQFSNAVWNRYLNPGDFPRWRLNDHLNLLASANLSVEILDSEIDNLSYAKIESSIHPMFDSKNHDTKVTRAVLLVRKSKITCMATK